ncbi:MAG: hypothetical protein IPJ31_13760 [Bacteroidetes bacterium]|nr:hypothetical protein [Bacteroidota bacterium]
MTERDVRRYNSTYNIDKMNDRFEIIFAFLTETDHSTIHCKTGLINQ